MPTHRELAKYCRWSYERQTAESDEVELLHIYHDEYTILVVRGTEASKLFGSGFVDMLRNLAIWKKKTKGVDGHAGFAQGWDAIKGDVKKIIGKRPSKPIKLSGHSAGGSIVSIGAINLLGLGYNVVELVTFGGARCIDKDDIGPDTLRKLESISFNYEHVRDWVPGFIKWTGLRSINTVFLGGRFRRPWFMRRFRFHPIEYYEKCLGRIDQNEVVVKA